MWRGAWDEPAGDPRRPGRLRTVRADAARTRPADPRAGRGRPGLRDRRRRHGARVPGARRGGRTPGSRSARGRRRRLPGGRPRRACCRRGKPCRTSRSLPRPRSRPEGPTPSTGSAPRGDRSCWSRPRSPRCRASSPRWARSRRCSWCPAGSSRPTTWPSGSSSSATRGPTWWSTAASSPCGAASSTSSPVPPGVPRDWSSGAMRSSRCASSSRPRSCPPRRSPRSTCRPSGS